MDARDLLPKDIFDNSNIEKIRALTENDFSLIAYDLLEWLQDYNWPVSNDIIQVRIDRQNLVVPYISDILAGKDIMWQYWILELFIPNIKREYQVLLKKDIETLASQTEKDEDTLAVVAAAKKCLDKCFAI